MKNEVVGIGNAIVDILCKVDDKYLKELNLKKGSMSLIDEETANKLSQLKTEKITSGGSVANTIATMAEIDQNTSFVGIVGDDEYGEKFISEITKSKVKFAGKKLSGEKTAKSFILVTPDAQRTMCTFLGCASKFNVEIINNINFKKCGIFYIEGYLWDSDKITDLLNLAISKAKKAKSEIAFTLSDYFVVSNHKKSLKHLVIKDLDIVFANQEEALGLVSWPAFNANEVRKIFSRNDHLIAAITRSEKGCVIMNDKYSIAVPGNKVENVIDTTGAGDAFAAGFLSGIINNYDIEKSAKLGNALAAKIITQFGARFDKKLSLASWYEN
jgi:sugar/nucleoside kinase (ribokinase family)